MTDTQTTRDVGHLTDEDAATLAALGVTRTCAWKDPETQEVCGLDLPEGSHVTRRYCDLHQRGGPGRRKNKQDAPPSVKATINLGKPATAKTKGTREQVEGSATAMLSLLGMVVGVTGDAVCSAALTQAAPQIAHQLAELSDYHPVIARVFAPMEGTGEITAWIGLVIAVSPVIVAILVHHNIIGKDVADKLAGGMAVAG